MLRRRTGQLPVLPLPLERSPRSHLQVEPQVKPVLSQSPELDPSRQETELAQIHAALSLPNAQVTHQLSVFVRVVRVQSVQLSLFLSLLHFGFALPPPLPAVNTRGKKSKTPETDSAALLD